MHMRYVRVTLILIQQIAIAAMGQTLKPAGTTPDQATRVTRTTTLSVQSGGNYIRIASDNLPAVVTYMPDTAFGPLPVAIMEEDTLEAKIAFDDCAMTWTWEVGKDDRTKIVEILAHENASLLVKPTVCPMSTDTVVNDVWDRFEWRGTVYTESGDYTISHETDYCSWTETLYLTLHKTTYDTYVASGCESITYHGKRYTESGVYADTLPDGAGNRTITTLNLTIYHPTRGEETLTASDSLYWNGKWYNKSGDYTYQTKNAGGCDSVATLHLTVHHTVYFCPGMHVEEEVMEDGVKTKYVAYKMESPSPDWYMEGVILEKQPDKALVDFRRAEQNLKEHYQLPLVPLTDIIWTFRSTDNDDSYVMEVKNEPQWVEAGTVSVVVRFLCGAPYYSGFQTDMESVDYPVRPAKVMENGMVIILRGGKRYNVLGTKIQ